PRAPVVPLVQRGEPHRRSRPDRPGRRRARFAADRQRPRRRGPDRLRRPRPAQDLRLRLRVERALPPPAAAVHARRSLADELSAARGQARSGGRLRHAGRGLPAAPRRRGGRATMTPARTEPRTGPRSWRRLLRLVARYYLPRGATAAGTALVAV